MSNNSNESYSFSRSGESEKIVQRLNAARAQIARLAPRLINEIRRSGVADGSFYQNSGAGIVHPRFEENYYSSHSTPSGEVHSFLIALDNKTTLNVCFSLQEGEKMLHRCDITTTKSGELQHAVHMDYLGEGKTTFNDESTPDRATIEEAVSHVETLAQMMVLQLVPNEDENLSPFGGNAEGRARQPALERIIPDDFISLDDDLREASVSREVLQSGLKEGLFQEFVEVFALVSKLDYEKEGSITHRFPSGKEFVVSKETAADVNGKEMNHFVLEPAVVDFVAQPHIELDALESNLYRVEISFSMADTSVEGEAGILEHGRVVIEVTQGDTKSSTSELRALCTTDAHCSDKQLNDFLQRLRNDFAGTKVEVEKKKEDNIITRILRSVLKS